MHVLSLDENAPNLRARWWRRAIALVMKLLRAVRLVNGVDALQKLLSSSEEERHATVLELHRQSKAGICHHHHHHHHHHNGHLHYHNACLYDP